MFRTDTRLERALLAVAAAIAVVHLVTVPKGEPVLSGDMIAIGTAVGVAVFASGDGVCGDCSCCP